MQNEIESDTSVLKSPETALHDQTKKSKKLWKRISKKKATHISKLKEKSMHAFCLCTKVKSIDS
jgi:hypothetical protein